MVIYLGLQLLVASSDLPESDNEPSRFAAQPPCDKSPGAVVLPLCLTLLRAGFTKPATSPRPLVSSYLTVSPLPRIGRSQFVRRYTFCGTFPNLAIGRRYRPLCSVKPGLSSPGELVATARLAVNCAAPRSDHLAHPRGRAKFNPCASFSKVARVIAIIVKVACSGLPILVQV